MSEELRRNTDAEIIDLLNRQPFIDELRKIIDLLSENRSSACYAINGEWGSGKTFVLNMLINEIEHIKNADGSDYQYILFYYNCWQYDYYDEPLIAIVAAMLDTIAEEKNYGISEKNAKRFFEVAKSTGISLAKAYAEKIKKKYGINPVEVFETGLEGLATASENWNEDHSYDSYFRFKQIVSELRSQIKKAAEDRTVVLIVDELDRCLPEYSVKILERLHHVFYDLDNVQVILAIDKRQLEHTIRQIFGNKTNVKQYLAKFISYEINLPLGNSKEDYLHLTSQFSYDTSNQIKMEEVDEFFATVLSTIDMRTRKAVFAKVNLCHRLLFNQKYTNPAFLCVEVFLVLLKYFGMNPKKAYDNYDISRLFIGDHIKPLNDEQMEGLLQYSTHYSNSTNLSQYSEDMEVGLFVNCSNLYSILLGCYRFVIGYSDLWPQGTIEELGIDSQEFLSFVSSFWRMTGSIN